MVEQLGESNQEGDEAAGGGGDVYDLFRMNKCQGWSNNKPLHAKVIITGVGTIRRG